MPPKKQPVNQGGEPSRRPRSRRIQKSQGQQSRQPAGTSDGHVSSYRPDTESRERAALGLGALAVGADLRQPIGVNPNQGQVDLREHLTARRSERAEASRGTGPRDPPYRSLHPSDGPQPSVPAASHNGAGRANQVVIPAGAMEDLVERVAQRIAQIQQSSQPPPIQQPPQTQPVRQARAQPLIIDLEQGQPPRREQGNHGYQVPRHNNQTRHEYESEGSSGPVVNHATDQRFKQLEDHLARLAQGSRAPSANYRARSPPFSRQILDTPLPQGFRMPKVDLYDGEIDPVDHLEIYRAMI